VAERLPLRTTTTTTTATNTATAARRATLRRMEVAEPLLGQRSASRNAMAGAGASGVARHRNGSGEERSALLPRERRAGSGARRRGFLPSFLARAASGDEESLLSSDGGETSGGDLSSSSSEIKSWGRVALAFVFPALGGLLFGYDIGATSGALVSLTTEATGGVSWYDLSSLQSGLVVSASLAGALCSSVAAFFVGDALGRRREILLAAVLYAAGTLLESTAPSFALLVAGRLVYGLGIGFAMHGAPAYIAETAPQSVRGLLISLKEVLIVAGILLGYLASYLFVSAFAGWRSIYLAAAPIAAILFAGMFWLPPSPRWLVLRSQPRQRVVDSLRKLRGSQVDLAEIEGEVEAMQASASEAKSSASAEGQEKEGALAGFGALLRRENLKPLLIGMSLMIFQQITGQPSVLYYATRIFQDAGFAAAESATAVSVILGFFKLLMTAIAVFTVDIYGRRPLLLTGVAGMVISLFILGTVVNPYSSVVALLLYVGCYQVSFGPVSWLLVGEIFPLAVRSSAIALASFANFGSNFLVSLVLPTIQSTLGVGNTYIAFAFIGVAAVATIYLFVPETKGKSLEEIERMFKD